VSLRVGVETSIGRCVACAALSGPGEPDARGSAVCSHAASAGSDSNDSRSQRAECFMAISSISVTHAP